MIQNINICSTSSSVLVINDKSKCRMSKFLIYNLQVNPLSLLYGSCWVGELKIVIVGLLENFT